MDFEQLQKEYEAAKKVIEDHERRLKAMETVFCMVCGGVSGFKNLLNAVCGFCDVVSDTGVVVDETPEDEPDTGGSTSPFDGGEIDPGTSPCPDRPVVNDTRAKWLVCYGNQWYGVYKKKDRITKIVDGAITTWTLGIPADFPPESTWYVNVPDATG